MEKITKIKLYAGIFYFVLVSLFLFFFFSKFSFQEITSYEFIKNNRDYFFELRDKNFLLLSVLFILFTTVWVLAAGFGSPVAIFAGFIFGKWFGLMFLLIGLSIGATGLYLFANFFLKEMVQEKFLNKYENLGKKFKRSEFLYLLIYRFIGGIPFAISNILPCIFNVKVTNFFWATFLGMIPQLFLVCSIGSGLEVIIDNNLEPPSFLELVLSKEIYIPLLFFVILVIISFIIRKIFYKN